MYFCKFYAYFNYLSTNSVTDCFSLKERAEAQAKKTEKNLYNASTEHKNINRAQVKGMYEIFI